MSQHPNTRSTSKSGHMQGGSISAPPQQAQKPLTSASNVQTAQPQTLTGLFKSLVGATAQPVQPATRPVTLVPARNPSLQEGVKPAGASQPMLTKPVQAAVIRPNTVPRRPSVAPGADAERSGNTVPAVQPPRGSSAHLAWAGRSAPPPKAPNVLRRVPAATTKTGLQSWPGQK